MFCRKCGEKLPKDAEFCFKCGENLKRTKNTIEQTNNNQINEQFGPQNNYQNQQQVVQPNNYQSQYQTTHQNNYQNYSNPNQQPSNKGAEITALKTLGIGLFVIIIAILVCVFAVNFFNDKIMIDTIKTSFYKEFPDTDFDVMINYTFDDAKWTVIDSKCVYFTGTHKGSNEDYNFIFEFDNPVGLSSFFDTDSGNIIDMNIDGENYKSNIPYIVYWLFDIVDSKQDLANEKFDISMLIEEEIENNPYAWLLDEIIEFANDMSFDHESLGLPYYFSFSDDNLSQMGYDYVDVNDDGVLELFIGAENTRGNFISCYTIVNDEIYPIVATGERYGFSLTNNMYFAYWGSNGMEGEDYGLLKLEKNTNTLSYIEYCTWTHSDSGNFDSPYYDYYVPIENGQPNFGKKRLYQNTELEYFKVRFNDNYQFNYTPF